jgi:hypothetical protein
VRRSALAAELVALSCDRQNHEDEGGILKDWRR